MIPLTLQRSKNTRTPSAAAVFFLLLVALLAASAPPALAGTSSRTLSQFTGAINYTTLSFGSCTSSDNSTSFTLPWDANVTNAWVDVYWGNYSNASNATGWVSADVGADSSVEANTTFSYYDSLNLTAAGFNRYLDARNATSGNVTVPFLLESCPPSGGWDLTFYNVNVQYTLNVSSNTSAPAFAGTIRDLTLRSNSSGNTYQYMPWYFSDDDGDSLNYSVVKANASDPGWTNVSLSFVSDYLHYNATGGWTGNLTFKVNATDPANQSASSNSIVASVVANQAPVLGGNLSDQNLRVNTSANLDYLPYYFYDPDGSGNSTTLTFSVVKANTSDTGWSHVNLTVSYDYLYGASRDGWTGNLTFRVTATDDGGLSVTSNNATLVVAPNQAPILYSNLSDYYLRMNTSNYLDYLPYYFYDPDGSGNSSLTFSVVKGNASDAGWTHVNLTAYGGSLYGDARDGWTGNLTFRVTATDDGGLSVTSNNATLTIAANGAPQLVYNFSDIELDMGSSTYLWVRGYFEDPDRDDITLRVVKSDPNATGWPYLTLDDGGNFSYGYLYLSHSGNWAGNVSLRLEASDTAGATALSNEFYIFVRSWPEAFANLPSQTIWRGQANYSAVDLTRYFRDLDQDVLNYTVLDPSLHGIAGGGGGGGNNSTNGTTAAYNPIVVTVNGTHLDIGSNDTVWTGSATYFVLACDPTYRCVEGNDFRVSVAAPPNRAPLLTSNISDIYIVQGTDRLAFLNLATKFSDPDGDALTFGIQRINTSAPEWAYLSVTLNGTKVSLRSLDSSWVGTLQLQFYARDSKFDQTFSNLITIHVVATDRPPSFSGPIGDLTMVAGTTLAPALDTAPYFTDPEGLPFEFEVLPADTSEGWLWLDFSFNGTRLEITSRDDEGWTGTACFSLRATDAVGSPVDSNVLCLTVTAPPNSPPTAVAPIPDLSVAAGASGTVLANLSLYFTDDRYAHRLVFEPQEAQGSLWGTVDLAAPGGLLTVTFTGPTPPGDLSYRILVTDLRGATLLAGPFTLHITAKAGNSAPSLTGPALVRLEASVTQSVPLQAADLDGDALHYTVTGAPGGLVASVNAATGVLQLTHNSLDTNLTADLLVTVDDGWGATASLTIRVAVFEPARLPELAAQAFADRTGTVWVNGTVRVWSQPPGAAPLTATILVDLVLSYQTPVSGGAFNFLIPQALAVGNHTADITVRDGFGRTGTLHVRFAVLAPPQPLPALTAISLNGALTSEVAANVPVTLTLGAASPFSADVEIRWLIDGFEVGRGRSLQVTFTPGLHTIRAEATNGVDTQFLEIQVTVTAPSGPPNPTPPGGDSGLVVAAAAVGGGLAIVGVGWILTRRRGK